MADSETTHYCNGQLSAIAAGGQIRVKFTAASGATKWLPITEFAGVRTVLLNGDSSQPPHQDA